MKQIFTLAAILALVFAACEQPTDNSKPGKKMPSLTIKNESSYVLTDVKFSGISFAVSGSNELPVSNQAVKQLTANDLNKTGYITFVRKDIGIALRTEAIAITDEDYTFTFTDNTSVEEQANSGNRNSLSKISFLSQVAVELGGLAVPRNDIVDIEGFANFTKQTEFTLKNTGVGKLLLTGTQPVKITGTGADAFSVIQPSSSEIAPNDSLTFKINFNPDAIQDYSATVTINSNDQDGDFTFAIRARGLAPKPIATVFYEDAEIAQNGTINADDVLITLSKTITVIIKNTGVEVLTLDTANIAITGADSEAFAKTTNPSGSISVGGQTSFVIECKPTKQGENNAILSIPTNDNARNPVIVYLKVTGVRGTGVVELTQASTLIGNNSITPFDFGRVEINTPSTFSFTIKNTGNLPLVLSGEQPVESSNALFVISSQPVIKTLNPNETTVFGIRFTPTSETDSTGAITIANNSDGGTFTFNIKGTGYVKRPQITIAYNNTVIPQNGTIDAGDVLLTLSKNITVVIKNTGEEPLTIDTANITITGDNETAFTKSTNPGSNISVGGESSFVIRCEPEALGENTAILTIPSNDTIRGPAVVYLKFTGVRGSGILQLTHNGTLIGDNSITPYNIGKGVLNENTQIIFTIKNTGNIPLVLTGSPAVTSSSAVFTVATQPPNTTIAPEATTSFIIQYTPTAEQTDTASISILNDSDDGLFSLHITGTGYIRRPQISVFYGDTEIPPYGTINAGDALTTQSKDIAIIIKNTGEALLTVEVANITITNEGANVFSKKTNPPTNVSVDNQVQLIIAYTPADEGEDHAILEIPTNDIFHSPYIVYLQASAVPVIYQIGDTGPAGGIIFYDNGSVINGWRYLEASLIDYNAQWGRNSSLVGNTGLSIGDGKENTRLIVAAIGQAETGRAAQLCAALNINGFDDWFLPSRDELNLMYQRKNTIGGFSNNDYWSSSEYSTTSAWYQNFQYSNQYSSGAKASVKSFRAIRSFK